MLARVALDADDHRGFYSLDFILRITRISSSFAVSTMYRVESKNVEVTSKPRAARPGQAGPARA